MTALGTQGQDHSGPQMHDDAGRHMDGIYRTQRHIYDATRKYYLLGRDGLIDGLRPPVQGRVLEVACGTGRNLICAARRYPQAQFYGLDISRAMLETAQRSIARAGLSPRIAVAEGDATDFSGHALFGVEQFDRVFISYGLSMIPDWPAALRAAHAAVAPGGSLHIVDFGDLGRLPPWFRAGLLSWLARFSVTPRIGLRAEVLALAGDSRAETASLYRDYAQAAVLYKTPA